MDMLANYADEGSNTPKTDTQEKVSEPNADYSELEAEWESFEKMMGDEVLISQEKQIDSLTKRLEMSESIPHTVPLPGENTKSRNSSESKSAKSKSVSSNDYYVGSSSDSSSSDADDETRSHSDDDGRGSEEESSSGRQRRSSKSSSSSESSASSDKSKTSDDVIEIRSPVKQASPQKDQSAKDISIDRKIGTKSSRSRSRSPVVKQRRSSDHRHTSHSKVQHRSSDRRNSHSRREQRHREHRSRSNSRDRHMRRQPSREHRHRDRSRDRHHKRGRTHDRVNSYRYGHRHSSRSPDRRKSYFEKKRSRSRSPDKKKSRSPDKARWKGEGKRNFGGGGISGVSESGGGEFGSRVNYRTAGVKFGATPGSGKPMTFKEQMRQQLLKASKMLTEKAASGTIDETAVLEPPKEKPSNLPLNPHNIFTNLPIVSAGCAISGGNTVTPQMALLQTMAAMHKQAQEMTGVEVPKYYNPAAVNPLKYAEQVQKRKLLWSKNKDKKETDSQWHAQPIVVDGDSKTAAKFRKLMGIKEDGKPVEEDPGESSGSDGKVVEEQRQKQAELFQRLDKEYEFARMATHTHRGVGLGFGSQIYPNH